MARLRFPGRPGFRFGRKGARYGKDESRKTDDATLKLVANIHRGLRCFYELFGESDTDEEATFEGFTVRQRNEVKKRLTTVNENLEKLRQSLFRQKQPIKRQTSSTFVNLPISQKKKAAQTSYKKLIKEGLAKPVETNNLKTAGSEVRKKSVQLSPVKGSKFKICLQGNAKQLVKSRQSLEVGPLSSSDDDSDDEPLYRKNKAIRKVKDHGKRSVTKPVRKHDAKSLLRSVKEKQKFSTKVSGTKVKRTDKKVYGKSKVKQLLQKAKYGKTQKTKTLPVSPAEKQSPRSTLSSPSTPRNTPKKQFVLPAKSARSSRVIKPNKRLLEEDDFEDYRHLKFPRTKSMTSPDFTSICSGTTGENNGDVDGQDDLGTGSLFGGLDTLVPPPVQNTDPKAGLFEKPLVMEGKRERKPSYIMLLKLSEQEKKRTLEKRMKIEEAKQKHYGRMSMKVNQSDREKLKQLDRSAKAAARSGRSILQKAKLQLNRAVLNKSKAAFAEGLKEQLQEEEKGMSQRCLCCEDASRQLVNVQGRKACRNCARFFFRVLEGKKIPKCTRGTGDCDVRRVEGQELSTCRGCRFQKFSQGVRNENLNQRDKIRGKKEAKLLLKRFTEKRKSLHTCIVCGDHEKLTMSMTDGVYRCDSCRFFYYNQSTKRGLDPSHRQCPLEGNCEIRRQDGEWVTKRCIPCRLNKYLKWFGVHRRPGLKSPPPVDEQHLNESSEKMPSFASLAAEAIGKEGQSPLGEDQPVISPSRKLDFGDPPDADMTEVTTLELGEPTGSTTPVKGGPRIKHVCRKAAVALGTPAKFPLTPELRLSALPNLEKEQILKEEEEARAGDSSDSDLPMDEIISRSEDKKHDVVHMKKTAPVRASPKKSPLDKGQHQQPLVRIPGRRMMRCKKCTGCITKDCGECVACRDMPKFGGKGLGKKACVKRKCANPKYPYQRPPPGTQSPRKEFDNPSTGRSSGHNSGHNSDTDSVISSASKSTVSEHLQTKFSNKEIATLTSDIGEKKRTKTRGNDGKDSDVPVPMPVVLHQKKSGKMIDKRSLMPVKTSNMSSHLSGQGQWSLSGQGNHTIMADFIEDYDIDIAWERGLSLIAATPFCVRIVCFLCGSAGHHDLIYCNICCEPFHTFCLEEQEKPTKDDKENWLCRRCQFCNVCGRRNNLLKCDKCNDTYHPECLGPNYPTKPSRNKKIWICTKCVKCRSCGATSPGTTTGAMWTHDFQLCHECGKLMDKGNYCPVCHKCYSDDDWESKMVQCSVCEAWVHAKCEDMTDEVYQLVTYLPDDVPFTCRICTSDCPAQWERAVSEERKAGFQLVIQAITQSKSAQHLMNFKQNLEDMSLSVTAGTGEEYRNIFEEEPQVLEHTTRLGTKFGSKQGGGHVETSQGEGQKEESKPEIKSEESAIGQACGETSHNEDMEVEEEDLVDFEKSKPRTRSKVKDNEEIEKSRSKAKGTEEIEIVDVDEDTPVVRVTRSKVKDTEEIEIVDVDEDTPVVRETRSKVKLPVDDAGQDTQGGNSAVKLLRERSDVDATAFDVDRDDVDADDTAKSRRLTRSSVKTASGKTADSVMSMFNNGTTRTSSQSGDKNIQNCEHQDSLDIVRTMCTSKDSSKVDSGENEIVSLGVNVQNAAVPELQVPPVEGSSISSSIQDKPDVDSSSGEENVGKDKEKNQQDVCLAIQEMSDQVFSETSFKTEKQSVEVQSTVDQSGSTTTQEPEKENDGDTDKQNVREYTKSLTISENSPNDDKDEKKDTESKVSHSLEISHSMVKNQTNSSLCQESLTTNRTTESRTPASCTNTGLRSSNTASSYFDHFIRFAIGETAESSSKKQSLDGSNSCSENVDCSDSQAQSLESNTENGSETLCESTNTEPSQQTENVTSGQSNDQEIKEKVTDGQEDDAWPENCPQDFHQIKSKMVESQYLTLEEFSDDIIRIIQAAIKKQDTLPGYMRKANNTVRSIFIKQMEKCFPWFNVNKSNLWGHNKNLPAGMLPDAVIPPTEDHTYAQWLRREEHPISPQPSPFKKMLRSPIKTIVPMGSLTENTGSFTTTVTEVDQVAQETSDFVGEDIRKCAFCGQTADDAPNNAGRLLYAGQDDWVHVNCALWSAEVFEEVDGSLQNVHTAMGRGRMLKCERCKQSGATVGCCTRGCPSNYHFLCARQANCVFQEDKKVFCWEHRFHLDGEVVKSDRFGVLRRACVDMENIRWTKKNWANGLHPYVLNILVGSMTVESLGKLSPISDLHDLLFPVEFCCTRVYWSTKDARRRCVYTCRVLEIQPEEENSAEIIMKDLTIIHDASHPKYDPKLLEVSMNPPSTTFSKPGPSQAPLVSDCQQPKSQSLSLADKCSGERADLKVTSDNYDQQDSGEISQLVELTDKEPPQKKLKRSASLPEGAMGSPHWSGVTGTSKLSQSWPIAKKQTTLDLSVLSPKTLKLLNLDPEKGLPMITSAQKDDRLGNLRKFTKRLNVAANKNLKRNEKIWEKQAASGESDTDALSEIPDLPVHYYEKMDDKGVVEMERTSESDLDTYFSKRGVATEISNQPIDSNTIDEKHTDVQDVEMQRTEDDDISAEITDRSLASVEDVDIGETDISQTESIPLPRAESEDLVAMETVPMETVTMETDSTEETIPACDVEDDTIAIEVESNRETIIIFHDETQEQESRTDKKEATVIVLDKEGEVVEVTKQPVSLEEEEAKQPVSLEELQVTKEVVDTGEEFEVTKKVGDIYSVDKGDATGLCTISAETETASKDGSYKESAVGAEQLIGDSQSMNIAEESSYSLYAGQKKTKADDQLSSSSSAVREMDRMTALGDSQYPARGNDVNSSVSGSNKLSDMICPAIGKEEEVDGEDDIICEKVIPALMPGITSTGTRPMQGDVSTEPSQDPCMTQWTSSGSGQPQHAQKPSPLYELTHIPQPPEHVRERSPELLVPTVVAEAHAPTSEKKYAQSLRNSGRSSNKKQQGGKKWTKNIVQTSPKRKDVRKQQEASPCRSDSKLSGEQGQQSQFIVSSSPSRQDNTGSVLQKLRNSILQRQNSSPQESSSPGRKDSSPRQSPQTSPCAGRGTRSKGLVNLETKRKLSLDPGLTPVTSYQASEILSSFAAMHRSSSSMSPVSSPIMVQSPGHNQQHPPAVHSGLQDSPVWVQSQFTPPLSNLSQALPIAQQNTLPGIGTPLAQPQTAQTQGQITTSVGLASLIPSGILPMPVTMPAMPCSVITSPTSHIPVMTSGAAQTFLVTGTETPFVRTPQTLVSGVDMPSVIDLTSDSANTTSTLEEIQSDRHSEQDFMQGLSATEMSLQNSNSANAQGLALSDKQGEIQQNHTSKILNDGVPVEDIVKSVVDDMLDIVADAGDKHIASYAAQKAHTQKLEDGSIHDTKSTIFHYDTVPLKRASGKGSVGNKLEESGEGCVKQSDKIKTPDMSKRIPIISKGMIIGYKVPLKKTIPQSEPESLKIKINTTRDTDLSGDQSSDNQVFSDESMGSPRSPLSPSGRKKSRKGQELVGLKSYPLRRTAGRLAEIALSRDKLTKICRESEQNISSKENKVQPDDSTDSKQPCALETQTENDSGSTVDAKFKDGDKSAQCEAEKYTCSENTMPHSKVIMEKLNKRQLRRLSQEEGISIDEDLPLHDKIALQIKMKSLEHTEEKGGPYGCTKCRRKYRTKESCQHHEEHCDYEDSSSSDDSEADNNDQSDQGALLTSKFQAPGMPKRGRGRPRKTASTVESREKEKTEHLELHSTDADDECVETQMEQKRRGRPRKSRLLDTSLSKDEEDRADKEAFMETPKRRGRPPKLNQEIDMNKCPPASPAITTVTDSSTERKRGRPRSSFEPEGIDSDSSDDELLSKVQQRVLRTKLKSSSDNTSNTEQAVILDSKQHMDLEDITSDSQTRDSATKRGPGRLKKKRGRPRKDSGANESAEESAKEMPPDTEREFTVKRQRGRPRKNPEASHSLKEETSAGESSSRVRDVSPSKFVSGGLKKYPLRGASQPVDNSEGSIRETDPGLRSKKNLIHDEEKSNDEASVSPTRRTKARACKPQYVPATDSRNKGGIDKSSTDVQNKQKEQRPSTVPSVEQSPSDRSPVISRYPLRGPKASSSMTQLGLKSEKQLKQSSNDSDNHSEVASMVAESDASESDPGDDSDGSVHLMFNPNRLTKTYEGKGCKRLESSGNVSQLHLSDDDDDSKVKSDKGMKEDAWLYVINSSKGSSKSVESSADHTFLSPEKSEAFETKGEDVFQSPNTSQNEKHNSEQRSQSSSDEMERKREGSSSESDLALESDPVVDTTVRSTSNDTLPIVPNSETSFEVDSVTAGTHQSNSDASFSTLTESPTNCSPEKDHSDPKILASFDPEFGALKDTAGTDPDPEIYRVPAMRPREKKEDSEPKPKITDDKAHTVESKQTKSNEFVFHLIPPTSSKSASGNSAPLLKLIRNPIPQATPAEDKVILPRKQNIPSSSQKITLNSLHSQSGQQIPQIQVVQSRNLSGSAPKASAPVTGQLPASLQKLVASGGAQESLAPSGSSSQPIVVQNMVMQAQPKSNMALSTSILNKVNPIQSLSQVSSTAGPVIQNTARTSPQLGKILFGQSHQNDMLITNSVGNTVYAQRSHLETPVITPDMTDMIKSGQLHYVGSLCVDGEGNLTKNTTKNQRPKMIVKRVIMSSGMSTTSTVTTVSMTAGSSMLASPSFSQVQGKTANNSLFSLSSISDGLGVQSNLLAERKNVQVRNDDQRRRIMRLKSQQEKPLTVVYQKPSTQPTVTVLPSQQGSVPTAGPPMINSWPIIQQSQPSLLGVQGQGQVLRQQSQNLSPQYQGVSSIQMSQQFPPVTQPFSVGQYSLISTPGGYTLSSAPAQQNISYHQGIQSVGGVPLPARPVPSVGTIHPGEQQRTDHGYQRRTPSILSRKRPAMTPISNSQIAKKQVVLTSGNASSLSTSNRGQVRPEMSKGLTEVIGDKVRIMTPMGIQEIYFKSVKKTSGSGQSSGGGLSESAAAKSPILARLVNETHKSIGISMTPFHKVPSKDLSTAPVVDGESLMPKPKKLTKPSSPKVNRSKLGQGQSRSPVKGTKKRSRKENLKKSAYSDSQVGGAISSRPILLPHHQPITVPTPENEEEVSDSPILTLLEHEEKMKQEALQQKRKSPYFMFEITSDDGFKVQAPTWEEAWRAVVDKVQDARTQARMKQLSYAGIDGLSMFGVNHDAIIYLVEQLYGAKYCRNYRFKHFEYDTSQIEEEPPLNRTGCIRSEPYSGERKPYDMFSFLMSKHKRLPDFKECGRDTDLTHKSARRATSLSIPMAMRFRHLREHANEAVGAYRSPIHGRGLFCKRDIDDGEMVVEYAGEVIRSVLTDKRERYYESKGIGCYMFRIDDFDVVDATVHGNAARFINHSCDPNCYSKVINVDGKKHIVIFALRPIKAGEELTYDYKFPYEEVKIPCSCNSKKCRKYLN